VLCDVDSASSGHGLAEECCEYGNELSGFMLRMEFLGWLSDNTFHKNCVCAARCIRRRIVDRLQKVGFINGNTRISSCTSSSKAWLYVV
jgi:hypothetical protein